MASSDSSDLLTDREAEHAAYQILLKLDDHGPFKRASGVAFLRDARATPPEVLTHPKVQARSCSHWFPYDRVRVVNADP